MACCIPLRIINPKYKKFVKHCRDPTTEVYQYEDRQDFYLDVPCGVCANCLKSRGTMWRTRLHEEWYSLSSTARQNSYFITLTISDDYINCDVAYLVRRFLERIRKKYKRSIRHWLITEYGDETKRLHLHGLLFDLPFDRHLLHKFWTFGFISYSLITARRISYVTSYVNKSLKNDRIEDPRYHQKIFTSPGLGASFVSPSTIAHSKVDGHPVPFMYNRSNHAVALPRYYRSKIFSEDDLEDLKERYYANLSDDVIPDPPYWIGNTRYDDYTVYLGVCKMLRKHKAKLYYKYKNYGKN